MDCELEDQARHCPSRSRAVTYYRKSTTETRSVLQSGSAITISLTSAACTRRPDFLSPDDVESHGNATTLARYHCLLSLRRISTTKECGKQSIQQLTTLSYRDPTGVFVSALLGTRRTFQLPQALRRTASLPPASCYFCLPLAVSEPCVGRVARPVMKPQDFVREAPTLALQHDSTQPSISR